MQKEGPEHEYSFLNGKPSDYTILVVLKKLYKINIPFLVVNWGMKKDCKRAFRPAMALSTGELSGLGGKLLMMTATATRKTMMILQDQFPEVTKWKTILNLPIRKNVTILIPPTETIPAKFENCLSPFIRRMMVNKETFLILVRGKS